MIDNLFISILEISIFTSPVIIIIILLAPVLNKRYNAKWKYYIWIIIAIRLVIPFHINVPYQKFILNIPPNITTPIAKNNGTSVPINLYTQTSSINITLLDIISFIWLAGFIIFLFTNLFTCFYYRRQIIQKGIYIKNNYILQQLSDLKDELHIKCKIHIIQYPGIASPMVTGFFHPLLILPDFQYKKEELFFILKHELVHIKQHDIFFKLLFLTANAMHWFNPVIYIMQKEVSISMELSCDEKVVTGTTYNTHKAYTETLLSVLHKQYKKNNKTNLSTQFYGGTDIMKIRFKNILTKINKKNGICCLIFIAALTIVSGMFAGCSITGQSFNTKTKETSSTNNIKTPIKYQQKNSNKINKNEKQESGNVKNNQPALSKDAIKIKKITEDFSNAYFNRNKKNLKKFLTSPYKWSIDTYTESGKISDITLKGLDNIGNEKNGNTCTVSLEFRNISNSDTFCYLTIELVKQAGNWKISFYGIEG